MMMSNPPSSLHNQQRMHRRQQSTPIASLEAMKLSTNLPPQRQMYHRRGHSFDQQRSPIRKQHPGNAVSMTNLGQFHGQQILREAQQQRITRPGQQQHNMNIEMPISPACGIYSASSNSIPGSPFDNMTMNEIMHQVPQGMDYSHSQQFFSDINMPVQSGLSNLGMMDENTPRYFQDMANLSPHLGTGMPFDDRRPSQPDLRVQTQLRPHTPSHQIQTAQYPLTPPFTQHTPVMQYSRSLQTSPALQSPFPVPMMRGRSLQGIVEHDEFRQDFIVTPTGAAFDMADMPVPESRTRSQASSPQKQSDPAKVKIEFKSDMPDSVNASNNAPAPMLKDRPAPILTSVESRPGSLSPTRPALSPRRMSISDLNLEPGIEASIEETNVTLDDIAQYIDGPDPIDNKWVCKFEDCNKKFGRKENIKSHVQTHLGDRQFRCDHCRKCFVRGHDLKRHAKIHTGTKPYPCLCGNSFARHDALTRHRQRGMCIGAFDGVVKKVIKRGRPRKHRPEMDERLDKAGRTRQKAVEHEYYTSSASSCSASSYGSPPTDNLENLSIRGSSPFDNLPLFGVAPQGTLDPMMSFPPDTFSFTPPTSPGYSTGTKPSPYYREISPADFGEVTDFQHGGSSQMLPELPTIDEGMPMMPMDRVPAQESGHSLPSLSHSCSSPAADVVAFDFSDMAVNDSSSGMDSSQLPLKLNTDRNDFDNFLDYGSMDMGMDASTHDFFVNL